VLSYCGTDGIPFFHAMAREFTVCDRWFSSVMGPTWPDPST
jgi:phospholipase C